jgi:hypothetical protein
VTELRSFETELTAIERRACGRPFPKAEELARRKFPWIRMKANDSTFTDASC